jgi:hypothetical protein
VLAFLFAVSKVEEPPTSPLSVSVAGGGIVVVIVGGRTSGTEPAAVDVKVVVDTITEVC